MCDIGPRDCAIRIPTGCCVLLILLQFIRALSESMFEIVGPASTYLLSADSPVCMLLNDLSHVDLMQHDNRWSRSNGLASSTRSAGKHGRSLSLALTRMKNKFIFSSNKRVSDVYCYPP